MCNVLIEEDNKGSIEGKRRALSHKNLTKRLWERIPLSLFSFMIATLWTPVPRISTTDDKVSVSVNFMNGFLFVKRMTNETGTCSPTWAFLINFGTSCFGL